MDPGDERISPAGEAPLERVPREPLLLVRLARGTYALRLSSVTGVADCGRMTPVPGAPAAVRGVTEWRGNPVTVLDLPRLLGLDAPAKGAACLIRLASPFEHLALRVPGEPRLTSAVPVEGSDRACAERAGVPTGAVDGVRPIDPARLLRDILAIGPERG